MAAFIDAKRCGSRRRRYSRRVLYLIFKKAAEPQLLLKARRKSKAFPHTERRSRKRKTRRKSRAFPHTERRSRKKISDFGFRIADLRRTKLETQINERTSTTHNPKSEIRNPHFFTGWRVFSLSMPIFVRPGSRSANIRWRLSARR